MCTPMAVVGMQGAGAASSMVGTYYGAKSTKSALGFQADMAAIDATTAERSAQAAQAAGQHQEQQSQLNTANLKAAQQVGFAANGIDLGEGSALHTLTSTDVMGSIDQNTIHANAIRQAWGYRTTATNYENDAIAKRSAAGAISPTAVAGTTALTGATQVASSWYKFKTPDLDAANASSDPIGSLAKLRGWTN